MKHWGHGFGIAIFCVACSSTTIEQVGSSGSGGTSGGAATSSGAPSVGGGSTTGSGSTALIGTWDVNSSLPDNAGVGVITIGQTTLNIDWAQLKIDANVADAAPAITASWRDTAAPVTTTRNPAPLDMGKIPFGVGGTWIFQGVEADRCNVTAVPALASLDCSNLARPLDGTLQEWDYDNSKPFSTGLSMAQRHTTLDSDFGDLGGEWTVILPRGNCAVKIAGSTLDATCTHTVRAYPNERVENGQLTLTFTDGFASGTSDVGEVSAKRR